MDEAVGEAGPSVDIGHNLGDANPRDRRIQLLGKQARGLWDDRFAPSDVELAVLDLHTVEFAACGTGGDEGQSLVHDGGAIGDVAVRIGFAPDGRCGVPCDLGRQQVLLKGAIVAAAGDPDVAALQPIAQRGEHGGLVEAPVRWFIGEDQPAPFRWQEGGRRPFGQAAGAVVVHRLDEFDGSQDNPLPCSTGSGTPPGSAG